MDMMAGIIVPRANDDPLARPVLPPPPGVTSNFVDPVSHQHQLVGVNATFLVVAMLFFVMRMYTRAFVVRAVGWDDYVCVLAAIFVILNSVATFKLVGFGVGLHAWDVTRARFRRDEYLLWNVLGYIFVMAAPALVKISILLLYLRLFASKRPLRIATYVLMAFIASYLIAFELSLLLSCRPIRRLIQANVLGQCIKLGVHTTAQASFNLATDFLVLLLPIPTVLRLKTSTRNRIVLMVLFTLGSMSCIASIVRIAYAIYHATLRNDDHTWKAFYSNLWALLEVDLALICACIPPLKPLFSYFSAPLHSITSKIKGPRSGSGRRRRGAHDDRNSSSLSKPSSQHLRHGSVELDSTIAASNPSHHDDDRDRLASGNASLEDGLSQR